MSGGRNWGVLGGSQKVNVENVYPEKGVPSQKFPVVPCIALYRNGNYLDSERPFLGWGEHSFKHRAQRVFCPHRVPGRVLSELLSAYYLCDKAHSKAHSPSFSENSPSLPKTQ